MNKEPLGRLEKIDLRKHWQNEASDFTPWLASDDNIALLGETIGIELEVQKQEAAVGPFSADILCRNTADNAMVVIENQLERTDHSHLGQVLTYAAGLDAVTIIWIASRFTEEHRAAIDWLNRISDEGFHFFGIEVELWRIGESVPAPKFNIIAKPNDWSKLAREAAAPRGELTETQTLMLRYWRSFNTYLQDQNARFGQRTPSRWGWTSWGIGRSNFHLTSRMSPQNEGAWVEVTMLGNDAKAHFHLLHCQREKIESELGHEVDWNEKPDGKESSVSVALDADSKDETQWPRIHAWTLQHLDLLDDAFRSRIAKLNASDWQPEDTDE